MNSLIAGDGSGAQGEKNAGNSKKIVDNQLVLTLSGIQPRGGTGEPGGAGRKHSGTFSGIDNLGQQRLITQLRY